jgi:hypothetical protein
MNIREAGEMFEADLVPSCLNEGGLYTGTCADPDGAAALADFVRDGNVAGWTVDEAGSLLVGNFVGILFLPSQE